MDINLKYYYSMQKLTIYFFTDVVDQVVGYSDVDMQSQKKNNNTLNLTDEK